ncbi:MAG: ferrous iron transport protein A [Phycisphaerales bacterium]|nr:MAG: ferrous iron transport protein A [Phycisphaerales bacterium]
MRQQHIEQNNARPLSAVRSGEKVRLAGIEAGRDLHSRLMAMGLVPNTEITVVSNKHPGPFVIMVKNSRMVLGRGMAHKIMVSACDHEKNNSRLSGQS